MLDYFVFLMFLNFRSPKELIIIFLLSFLDLQIIDFLSVEKHQYSHGVFLLPNPCLSDFILNLGGFFPCSWFFQVCISFPMINLNGPQDRSCFLTLNLKFSVRIFDLDSGYLLNWVSCIKSHPDTSLWDPNLGIWPSWQTSHHRVQQPKTLGQRCRTRASFTVLWT